MKKKEKKIQRGGGVVDGVRAEGEDGAVEEVEHSHRLPPLRRESLRRSFGRERAAAAGDRRRRRRAGWWGRTRRLFLKCINGPY